MTIGFTSYTQPTPVVEPTLKEKIALLSNQQKLDMLDAFINKLPPTHIYYKIGIAKETIEEVFNLIDNIQITSKALLRGEVVITPAVLDTDGITVITPAVMNTPPTTQTALGTVLNPLFDDFTSVQVTAIVSAMVKWSKHDGTGTFVFYKSQTIL